MRRVERLSETGGKKTLTLSGGGQLVPAGDSGRPVSQSTCGYVSRAARSMTRPGGPASGFEAVKIRLGTRRSLLALS